LFGYLVLLPSDKSSTFSIFLRTPTMAKWTKSELLCNARGLDDGYLFLHSSHPLAPKLKTVIQKGKTAKAPKTRLTDAASYGCAGFTGSFRPPLSNEIFDLDDEDVKIEVPFASSKAEFTSHDSLFTEPIIANDSLCVAFTEPAKLSHKSIMLPGAVLLPATLNNEDKRIRRPRLNRGGGTIANMGTSNGQSQKSGYGSMNINSSERDLAQRMGRGNQMNQAGTRAWGAMEPTVKRQYQGRNPFQQGGPNGSGPPQHQQQNRPPWQQQQQQFHHQNPGQGYQQQQQQQRPPHYQNHQQQQQGRQQQQGYNQGYQQLPQQQGYQQQQQQQRNYQSQPPHNRNPHQRHQPQQRPQGQRQGFDFRNVGHPSGPPNRPPQNNQQSPQVNANVMSSLKAQLASTLNKNRRPNK
jgi:hypothetical protein